MILRSGLVSNSLLSCRSDPLSLSGNTWANVGYPGTCKEKVVLLFRGMREDNVVRIIDKSPVTSGNYILQSSRRELRYQEAKSQKYSIERWMDDIAD